jgi:tetratricopeptide (TPR) repeat protein
MNIRSCKVFITILATIGLMLLATPASAQNRAIKGTVTDDKGEPLADVTIYIQATDTTRNLETKTDKKGEYYYLLGIQPYTYRVIARKEGFAPQYKLDIRPEFREEVEVNFQLTPGQDAKLPWEYTKEEIQDIKKQQEKHKEASKYSEAVKKNFETGVELFDQKQYAEAINSFNEAIKLDPTQPAVYARLGDSYRELKKYDEALQAYDKAIELEPSNTNLLTNKGVVLNKLGKTKEAQKIFKEAADKNPTGGAQSLYNLGVTMLNDSKMEEAANAFRQAIAADPDYSEAYFRLGQCLSGDVGTIPEAIETLKKYVQIGKNKENVEMAKQLIQALESLK